MRQPTIFVSEQAQHKPACTVTEKSNMLESLVLRRRGITLYLCSDNKGADQLCSNCTADLRLCFRIGRLLVPWCGGSSIELVSSGNSLMFVVHWRKRLLLFDFCDPPSMSRVSEKTCAVAFRQCIHKSDCSDLGYR